MKKRKCYSKLDSLLWLTTLFSLALETLCKRPLPNRDPHNSPLSFGQNDLSTCQT